MQAYTTVAGSACATITEKKSQFIANVSFADTEEKALAFLNNIKAEHRTANHNVFAYCLQNGHRQRYSDDGEPAKTAGLPVLETLTHAGVNDAIIVVTRYFGGVLLGTGGLVRAYAAAAKEALNKIPIVTINVCVQVQFTIAYNLYEQAQRICQQAGAKLEPVQFGSQVCMRMCMLDGTQQTLLNQLSELTRGAVQVEVSAPFYGPF